MSALAFEHSTEESNNERLVLIKLILGKLIKTRMEIFGVKLELRFKIEIEMRLGHWQLAIGHWSLVIGHWSLVIGNWSLAISHWSLVIGHWSLAIGNFGILEFSRMY